MRGFFPFSRPEREAPAALSKAEPEAKAGAEAKAEAKSRPEAKRDPESKPDAATKPEPPKPAPVRRRASRLWWALPILMVVEFYFYGHNGRLEICVGKEGLHGRSVKMLGQELR